MKFSLTVPTDVRGWEPCESLPAAKPRSIRSLPNAYYTGANLNAGSWLQALRSKDEEVRASALALRSASRALANNNPIMSSYLRLLGSSVIGAQGMAVKSLFKAKSTGSRRDPHASKIEAAFRLWSKAGTCTVCGRYSFADVQRLFLRTEALDGETFIRIVLGPGARNRFGIALQMLDADLLDNTFNVVGGEGQNSIVQGVELDSWGRPVAYWFNDPANMRKGGAYWAHGSKIRIPAAEIIHGLRPDRAIQTRGVPWAASIMFILQMLGGYWEAEVMAARNESERIGILKDPQGLLEGNGGAPPDPDSLRGSGVDPVLAARRMGNQTQISWTGVPAGLQTEFPRVQHPTTAFGQFTQAQLKLIASGLGVSYADLTGDLTQVNFSSIRQGALTQRDTFRELQGHITQTLVDRVYEAFVFACVWLSGQLTLPPGATLEAYSEHSVEARGWDWVDPLKDLSSKTGAIAAGLDTRTRVLAQMGLDFDETVQKLAEENAKLRALDLPLYGPPLPGIETPDMDPDPEDAEPNPKGDPNA